MVGMQGCSVRTKFRKKENLQDGFAFQWQQDRQAKPGLLGSSYVVQQKPLPVAMFYGGVMFSYGSKHKLGHLVWKQQTSSGVEKSMALQHSFRQLSPFQLACGCMFWRGCPLCSFRTQDVGCTSHFRRQDHLTFKTAYLYHGMLCRLNSS